MHQWERVRVFLRAHAADSSPTQNLAGQNDGRTVAAQLGDEAARVRLRRVSALSADPCRPGSRGALPMRWPLAAVGCDESGLSRPNV